MLIDQQTRDLVGAIDQSIEEKKPVPELAPPIRQLVHHLRVRCQQPENQSRYTQYPAVPTQISPYPLDSDGFAQAFDPLTEEDAFYDHWSRLGLVVNSKIIPNSVRKATITRIHDLMKKISNNQCDLSRPETYSQVPLDKDGIPILSRGFFEIYHDNSLAQLRQAVHAYIHHVVLWGTTDLWTTFDRFGVKLPQHQESKGLPLHVDQNPRTNPDFNSIQGVLALADCPTERGTLLIVPGSKNHFHQYRQLPSRGEFVQLDLATHLGQLLATHAQPIPLRAGHLVSWDSRTTHSNTENTSNQTRLVTYLAAAPAKENRPDLIAARQEAYLTGLACYNHEALLRVTQKPRFTDQKLIALVRHLEQLHLLGQLLYGHQSYRNI